MARIRSIKPDFFRHEGLQDLEAGNPGSYVMLTFAGLWGHCDKLGRFRWRPRVLKLDILPFLDFDMTKTLMLLQQGGYVRRYKSEGEEYGEVVSFEKHQRISGKEAQEAEKHPEPAGYEDDQIEETTGKQQGSIGEAQETAGMEYRNGVQEGKGTEITVEQARRIAVGAVFDHWRETMNHPRAVLDTKRRKVVESRLRDGYTQEQLCIAISGCALSPFHMGENDNGVRYDGLDLILRDAAKVDQFVAMFENPPKPKTPVADAKHERRARWLAELRGGNNDAIIATARLVG